MLKKVLKKYRDGLHALQIEELTIKYELGKRRTHENSSQANSTSQGIANLQTLTPVDPIHVDDGISDGGGQCISQKSLNLDANPLI